MNALVVDDSAAMRRIEQRALEQMGFVVVSAGNGREALAALGAMERCDLLLTDWHMPEMDGVELVRAVRAQERWGGLRILMITSESVLGAVENALSAGADDYLVKPFSPDSLTQRVAEVMRA